MSAVIDIEMTHTTANGARYRVWHDGEVLVASAREPLCTAARALVEKGVTGRVQMRRVGSERVDMSGLIAVFAAMTVSESQVSAPKFARYSEAWIPAPSQGELA